MKSLLLVSLLFMNLLYAEIVTISTTRGPIVIFVDTEHAPITAQNFLAHIRQGNYGRASFYRVARNDEQETNPVAITIVQGGVGFKDALKFDPIQHESTSTTGIRHVNGTISMARKEIGSATTEFFICLGDQPQLDERGKRNPDGQGFAAFGKVTQGLKILEHLVEQETQQQILVSPLKILCISISD